MLVTKISPLSKTRYQIYLDGKSVFVLYIGEVQKYHLSEGIEISEEVLKQIKTDVLLKRAKLRALHLLNDMDRTEAGLAQKLLQGGYPEDVVAEALTYVKSFGYVDDKRYAEQYVRSRQGRKSKRELYAGLVGKGIDSLVAKQVLAEYFSDGKEQETILHLLQKKNFIIQKADDKAKKKMFDYLMRKGFRYEDIRQALQVSSMNA